MNKKNLTMEFLRDNPMFWSRLGFCYDPPTKGEDGFPIVFSKNYDKFINYHRMFAEAGVKVHTSILHSGWVGVDEYDYLETDKVIESIMQINDIYYMPRIKLNVPVSWCKDNPEDVFVYDKPLTKDEILNAVDTTKQDILGYESSRGYYQAGEYIDTRPNVGGIISLQSLSSKKWLNDAAEALKRLIVRIENSKFADRIIGYQVAFGPCGESMHWGRATNRYGDYGINHLKNFYDFGICKYGKREILSEKWFQPDISRNNITIPDVLTRYGRKDTLKEFFRGSKEDIILVDYDEFLSNNVVDALNLFGKTVKENSNNKICGGFYGYFIHIGNAGYAGHLELEKLLNTDYIDFLAAPIPYYRRSVGEPSGEMCSAQSVNLKKLWVDEIDIRTHKAPIQTDGLECCKNIDDTVTIFWREAVKCISHNSSFWWMDLGGGWFDDKELIPHLKSILKFNKTVRSKKHESVSDVLIVVDEKSIYNMTVSEELKYAFLEDFICEAHCSGALVDVYRYADLFKMDLSQYKLIIFAYNFNVNEEEFKSLKLPENCTIMYNYAFGIHSDKYLVKNIKKLTGFDVLEDGMYDKYRFPKLKFADFDGDLCEKTIFGKNCIMNLRPYMKADDIRKIAQNSGAKIYTPGLCTVYGDNRAIGFFSKEDISGEFLFPQYGKYTDAITLESFVGEKLNFKLNKNSARVFYIE